MKKIALITSLVLLASVAALSQTYTNANLNGTYAFQSLNPQLYTWSKTFTCPTNSMVTYTATASQTTDLVSYGTVTFDGVSSLTIIQTQIGAFNFTASANTMSVTWNSLCQVTKVNTGMLVYSSATNKTQSATYSVQSNGTGTITDSKGHVTTFILAGTNSTGTSTTIFLAGQQINGQTISATTAIHQ